MAQFFVIGLPLTVSVRNKSPTVLSVLLYQFEPESFGSADRVDLLLQHKNSVFSTCQQHKPNSSSPQQQLQCLRVKVD